MSTLRERRLQHDHAALQRLIAESKGRIALEKSESSPAEAYILVFYCRGVASLHDGQPKYTQNQRVRIQFPALYPAEPPQAVMLSSIFHPHVWPNQTICLGKWSPAEKLDSLILRIASILVFDPAQFNWKSVANHEAAVWAQHNPTLFPLDNLFAELPNARDQHSFSWSEDVTPHG